MKCSIKPGDFIEWAYTDDDKVVMSDECLWSSTMGHYVSIGSQFVHIVIATDRDKIAWLNEKGLFSALVADTYVRSISPHAATGCFVRKVGL
jgi:hypothetical protein